MHLRVTAAAAQPLHVGHVSARSLPNRRNGLSHNTFETRVKLICTWTGDNSE